MELPQLFKLLSDESKFKIVKYLMGGERCVCTIAKDVKLEQSLVSHHLNKLREAGLVLDRKVGPWVHCSLNRDLFELLKKRFLKELNVTNIKNKPCSVHDICCALPKKYE